MKDSPVLILDEATSSIDKEYDKFIHDMILNEFSDKTIFMITHKRENLEGMDKVYRMEKGKLKEVLEMSFAVLQENISQYPDDKAKNCRFC